ncbi:DUF1761 domain-containing protein [Candidatus Woesearchaeota archaeon]|nr:DUF1761 domain-containing protein [Candidatus Woesearchaeota archaeon]
MPYPAQGFGVSEYYSVYFDGEGEATVGAKLQVTDYDGKLEKITIEVPGQSRMIHTLQRVGAGYSKIEYNKETLSKSVKYTLYLEDELEEGEMGDIILYYKATGYADEKLGVFGFDFESIKWKYDTDYARVAVNVGPDLYLKGGESRIDYRQNLVSFEAASTKMDSAAIEGFGNSITYQSGYVKEARGLDPWESFHVEGEYSKSRFSIHKGKIILGLLGTCIVVWLLVLIIGKIKLRKPRSKTVRVIGAGAASAFLFTISWSLMYYSIRWMDRMMRSRQEELIMPLIAVMAAGLMLAIVFGPPIYIGLRYGFGSGLMTFISFIAALFLIIIFLVVFINGSSHIGPMHAVAEIAMSV